MTTHKAAVGSISHGTLRTPNPDIPEETKAARREAAAKRQAQEEQWRRDRELRDRAWPTRRVDSYVAAAKEIARIADNVKARQTMFLESRGMTWDQARALPQSDKDQLNRDWQAWDKANSVPA